MKQVLRATWPLYLGMAFAVASNGLLGSLLAVRAFDEGFDTSDTGLVMAGFFMGYLLGALMTPKLIARIGHAKVFAVVASAASGFALLFDSFVNVPVWLLLRIAIGFCFAAIFIVTETWLNDRSSNETRGQVLNLYVMVTYAAMGIGSILLCVTDPETSNLFILASVLISFGIIPVLMSTAPSPAYESPRRMGLIKLLGKAPLGVGVMFLTGMAQGALIAAGPIYADKSELTTIGIAAFMSIIYLASLVFMVPLGHLADRFERGRFIIAMSGICVVLAVVQGLTPPSLEVVLYGLTAIFSALCLAHYGLALAATNDALAPDEMVGAGATLFIFCALGMILGPIVATEMIEAWRPPAFFYYLAGVHALIVAYALAFLPRRRLRSQDRPRLSPPPAFGLQGPLATAIALSGEVRDRTGP
ncbi:MAG: MFS transporter [Pseudomonadota bacterium]